MNDIPKLDTLITFGGDRGNVIYGIVPLTKAQADEVIRQAEAYPKAMELLEYFAELPAMGIKSQALHVAKLEEYKVLKEKT